MTREWTPTEKKQTFERTLAFQAERKATATTKFAESVANHGLLYTIEWGRAEAETVAQAELWETVETLYTGADDERDAVERAVAALSTVVAEVEKQLLRNWVRKSSTDEFSNAVSGAKANGHARFHEEATGLLAHLTR